MGKRRSAADHRRFFDEFASVKIPRLRAMGVVQLDAPHAIIQVGDRQKLIGLAHTKFRNGGSWSLFRCPRCARRANRLWLIEDRPLCRHCCEGIGIVHRSKWGFGRHERLRTRDQKLDELVAKLEATTPLRFNPAPKHWRGRARLVSNSRRLTARMRRSLIFCRLAMLASQQAAKQGDDTTARRAAAYVAGPHGKPICAHLRDTQTTSFRANALNSLGIVGAGNPGRRFAATSNR
jgi:hypothetical protein